jgi:ABC-2 type transport system permease protein
MSYRRTKAVFVKELRHIVRDARSLAMALLMPVMMLLLYGFALSLDVDRISTMIYDQDGSAESRGLMRHLQGSRFLEIAGFVDNYRAIEEAVDAGDVLIGVVIPPRFGEDLKRGRDARVQLLVDGSDSNTASIAMNYAQAIARDYSDQLRANVQRSGRSQPAIDARVRVWYNPSLESKNYVVPGMIAVILMILAGQLTSLTVAREWEMGTMEQVLSTPLRPTEIVLGKMAAYFVVGLADAVIALIVGVGVFEVPFRGSLLVMGVSTCIFLFGALFTGIYISTGARTQMAAYQAGMFASFLPAFMLSGFVFPIESMPAVIQAVSYVVPARYFVVVLKAVFLKGEGFAAIWTQLAFLALYGLIVFRLSVRRMNQKVA